MGIGGQRCGLILVTVAQNSPVDTNRSQRVLAYMIASAIGLSLVAIFAVLIAGGASVDLGEGLWPTIRLVPLVGFPIGFILIFALLITSLVRRGNATKDAGN
jgi:uncharacterized membrane protein